MISDTNKFFIAILVVGILAGLAIGFSIQKKESKMGYGGNYNIFTAASDYDSYGKAWASTTAGKIIDENGDRTYLSISNNGTNTVFMWPATSSETYLSAAAGKGIAIFASSTEKFFPHEKLFYSEVIVVTGTGEAKISWFEE